MNADPVYARVKLALIDEPEHQLREAIDPERLTELADSIAAEDLHQPIGVRGPTDAGRFEIVWGHRRLLAVRLLQWVDIPARVFDAGFDPLLAAVSENLQREDLTAVDEGHAVQKFLDRGHSIASIARLFRRSQTWVHARLRVLHLPEDVRAAIRERRLPLTVAEALAEIDHDAYRGELLDEAERMGASRVVVDTWVAHYKADRDRIVSNHLTVAEIAARREEYKIYFTCDTCRAEVPYEQTRSVRCCLRCTADLAAVLQEESQQPG